MPMRRAALALALLPGLAAGAEAANRSAPFSSRITINSGCSVSVGDLIFAATSTLTGTETTTSTIAVRCTQGTLWIVSFNAAAFATSATGVMAGVTPGNTDTINYNMNILGFPVGFGNGLNQTLTLRGTISTAGGVRPDNYIQARTLYVIY